MIDPITLSLIFGICTLVIERIFSVIKKIHKSKCWNVDINFDKHKHKKRSTPD